MLRKILLVIVLLLIGISFVSADFKFNPYTNKPDYHDMRNIAAPSPFSPSTPCTRGEITCDDTYMYVCTATDTWKRISLSTWAVAKNNVLFEEQQVQFEGNDVMF